MLRGINTGGQKRISMAGLIEAEIERSFGYAVPVFIREPVYFKRILTATTRNWKTVNALYQIATDKS